MTIQVSVSNMLRARTEKFWFKFRQGAREFSLLQIVPGAHPGSSSMGTVFLGLKRPGRDADHSPVSSVEFKNGWSVYDLMASIWTVLPYRWPVYHFITFPVCPLSILAVRRICGQGSCALSILEHG